MRGSRLVRVYLAPVGCPKANVDLEKSAWAITRAGFDLAPSADQADFVVVFTCGFIDDAKRESIDQILGYAALKGRSAVKGIVVAGCLVEKHGADLAREIPEADLLLGNTSLDRLAAGLRDLAAGKKMQPWAPGAFERRSHAGPGRARPADRQWTRTVLVSDGCSNGCTYCAIPQMRGPLRSRTIQEVLDETRLLVSQGAKEIVLAGQDTASYGLDTGGPRLAELLAAVAADGGARWIRLAYASPDNLPDEVASVIADYPAVCHYVDLPVQHAAPRVLAAMGRRKDAGALRQVIASLRGGVPDIALRTSVIVGFPGETEADFGALVEFLAEQRFDMAGVFRFSPQEGTPAAGLPSRVPAYVAEERLIEVTTLQVEIARDKAAEVLGREVEMLVEEVRGGVAIGRSQYDMAEVDRSITVRGRGVAPGEFARVRLEGCGGPYEFLGVPV
ncbi:MAG: 30S ribosomal protein S12 methylthiotransferase RimO [bacterium]